MSEQDTINAVLGGFVPVGEDHPVAQETLASVRELLEARNGVVETTEELQTLVDTTVDMGTIRPGDTVIFSANEQLSLDMLKRLKELIEAELPGVKPVILGGLHIEGIYRPEEEG